MLSCGIDLALNSRFSDRSTSFLSHIFTPFELRAAEEYAPSRLCEYYASRFAAKEALSKALGCGFSGISPLEAEVHSSADGSPYLVLSGRAETLLAGREVSLSLTHEGEYSAAMVVIYGEK